MMIESGSRPKILYIDDDELQRKIISVVVSKHGYEIRTASNGKEGVALAQEWLPDLILMDIMMPVMDGIQATEQLRADSHTRHIPILALTTVIDEDIQTKIKAAGINDIISKTVIVPFRLIQKIQKYLT